MLETRLTEKLGCRYPIVQTAMGWVADPRLVAGSCNAGGFGFLAGATIPAEEIERDILRVKELTEKPVGGNFHMYQPNAAHIVDLVVEHGVKAVSYSRSPGPEFIRRLKDAGVVCMPTVGLPNLVRDGRSPHSSAKASSARKRPAAADWLTTLSRQKKKQKEATPKATVDSPKDESKKKANKGSGAKARVRRRL